MRKIFVIILAAIFSGVFAFAYAATASTLKTLQRAENDDDSTFGLIDIS